MEMSTFYTQILGLESPWFISNIEVNKGSKEVHVYLSHSSTNIFSCPKCNSHCSVHDHNKERIWRHLDTCNYSTYLHASLPRVKCLDCGVHTIISTWSDKKSRFTLDFESYIIDVLGQTQVISRTALLLGLSSEQVSYVRDKAVARGLSKRKKSNFYKVSHLCIDEKSLFKGHHYVTIFYDGETGTVLEVVEHRTIEATNLGFSYLGECVDLSGIEVVTMDMWEAFKTATKNNLRETPIVHDRFHLAQHLNKAVDITRRAENKSLVKQEDDCLKQTKYLWLKNPEKLTESKKQQLDDLLLKESLKTVQAYQKKEEFKNFFNCQDKKQAEDFFNDWYEQVQQSQISPLIKVGKMLKKNLPRLLNYFKHRVTNAMAESKNTMIQQIKFKARGFKSAKAFRNAILFFCGELDLYP